MRRVMALVLLAIGIASGATVALPVIQANHLASAEVYTCDTPSGSYFDGSYTSTSSVVGTAADIVNRQGAVCDTDTSQNNVSASWSMIAGNAGSCQYAQAGFVRWYASPDYFFAQDNDCGGMVDTTFGASPGYGQTHHYWAQWDSSCSCIHENVGVTIFQSTPWNPYSVWNEPFSNQWLGETHHLASDMPGNPSVGYNTYTQMQVQQSGSGSWTNTLPATSYANSNIYRYDYDAVVYHSSYGNAMDIWTYYEY